MGQALSPRGAHGQGLLQSAQTLTKEQTYQLRKRHTCPAQSIAYENTDPLLIVGGEAPTPPLPHP